VSSAPGVHDGRYARADAKNIRIRAKRAQAGHQVQMNVDQSGRDEKARGIDHGCALDLEICSNRRYNPVAHPDVEKSVSAAPGIKHMPAFQNIVGWSGTHLDLSLCPKLNAVKAGNGERNS
jgi:hypothetical protein